MVIFLLDILTFYMKLVLQNTCLNDSFYYIIYFHLLIAQVIR
jgi:hypothetical protein